MSAPLRIAVLASGSGSNLQALIAADLGPTELTLVISNVPGARALRRAEAAGIEALLIDHQAYATREAFDGAVVQALQARDVDWVVLAGFMRLITPVFVEAYENRILNIHPGLLPAFKGVKAQRQALEAGVTVAGCTVHLVDAGMDSGPILAQAVVPVRWDDDEERLCKRILRQEHRLLPAVVRAVAEGRLVLGAQPHFHHDSVDDPNDPLVSPIGLV